MSPSTSPTYDIFIIGGGINGCGIARDAVGRGYQVCLCEAGDFAGGTSSASTKLIHGGLRYLEHYEFRLVRESLMEREVLWKMAPHIIWPLRFILPHHKGMRPQWLLRLGLFIYDHLGGRHLLPASRKVDLKTAPSGQALQPQYTSAFEYSDLWVEDSRLVILNAMDARKRGAEVKSRTRVVSAERYEGKWRITIEDTRTNELSIIYARSIVNASGPWADEVLRTVFGQNDAQNVRLVKGSHIVVRKKFQHEKCYLFQNSDNRIIFAIPYEQDYTLIGTTDVEHGAILERPEITPEEIAYLCQMASAYFREPVSRDDVQWTYSGVRPLFDDGATAAQEATRDYVLKKDIAPNGAPLINIFGGKITTFRKLSEAVVGELEELIEKKSPAWTVNSTLPGGNFLPGDTGAQIENLKKKFVYLDDDFAARLVRGYGTLALELLTGTSKISDLGKKFSTNLYQKEVDYLIANEWAKVAEDVLFRRTKLGIAMSAEQIDDLEQYMRRAQNL